MIDTEKTLEELLEQRVITGYNVFDRPLERQNYAFILSNLHNTEGYLEDVKKDLSLLTRSNRQIKYSLRNRDTTFIWRPSYKIRDDHGRLYENLLIRKGKEYLDLEKIFGNTLMDSDLTEQDLKNLIAEAKGYEIVVDCKNREEICALANLFRRKSIAGGEVVWKDAYDVPLILLEGIRKSFPGFEKIRFFKAHFGEQEISFITPLSFEKSAWIKGKIFKERIRYANKVFIQDMLQDIENT
ncbi:MAG: hypothetical protein Q8R18_03775 [bacterium]|nr:hypothetical protein [bacterium]